LSEDFQGRRAERGIPVLPTPFVAFTTPWMGPPLIFIVILSTEIIAYLP